MEKPPKSLGKLHELLIRGIPDFVDNGTVDVKGKLAPHFAISYQAIYKWFERERISGRRMRSLIKLSESTVNRPRTMVVKGKEVPWAPLKMEDFDQFV